MHKELIQLELMKESTIQFFIKISIEKDKLNSVSLNYKWVTDEHNNRLLMLQDETGFRHEHRARIEYLQERIIALKALRSEALLVISRIAYQLKEDHTNLSEKSNVLEILSF